MRQKTSIVWFRKDLRLEDNHALAAAINKGDPIIPLYIWAPEEEEYWLPGSASRWWLHHSLLKLQAALPSLIIQTGKSITTLLDVAKKTGADAVFWNRRYDPAGIRQASEVKIALGEAGITAKSYQGNLMFEPWTIMNKQRKAFQVFTPFWNTCLAQKEPTVPQPPPSKAPLFTKTISSLPIDKLKLLPTIPWDIDIKRSWNPGEAGAKEMLASFLPKVNDYSTTRDRPDINGVSRLSPHLHFGEISINKVWHDIKSAWGTDGDTFLRQLGWREFANHLLYHFPHTPNTPLREKFKNFPWNKTPSALAAWQQGATGYPIVDAGMRQLWKTGWMHNRVRMIVGSFLVKDLLISWHEGAKWFWDTLVDADLANNTLGWQWVGGCGADAAPYFRIFNPITQGKKFDPEGSYVRAWVPELSLLDSKWIHHPWEAPSQILEQSGVKLGTTYPYPIVDHANARKDALHAFSLC